MSVQDSASRNCEFHSAAERSVLVRVTASQGIERQVCITVRGRQSVQFWSYYSHYSTVNLLLFWLSYLIYLLFAKKKLGCGWVFIEEIRLQAFQRRPRSRKSWFGRVTSREASIWCTSGIPCIRLTAITERCHSIVPEGHTQKVLGVLGGSVAYCWSGDK